MTIDWSLDGNIIFTMYDYLEDILAKAPVEFDGEDVTSANSELFLVDHVKVSTYQQLMTFITLSQDFCMWQRGQDLIYK